MAVDTSTMNGFWSDQPNLLCTTARVIGGSALLYVNERSPPALAFAKVRLFETRPNRLWEGKSFVIQQFLWLIVHGWSTENLSFWPHLDEQSKKLQNVYSNLYSQAVTHPSTNRSQPCLTSVIGRELVYSRWYGRRQPSGGNILMQIFKNGGHMYTWTTFILGHVTGLLAEWKIFLEEFCMNRLLWFLLQRCSVFESRIAFGLKTYS